MGLDKASIRKMLGGGFNNVFVAHITNSKRDEENANYLEDAAVQAVQHDGVMVWSCADYDDDKRELVEIPEFRNWFFKILRAGCPTYIDQLQRAMKKRSSVVNDFHVFVALATESDEVRRKGKTIKLIIDGMPIYTLKLTD